ncbi:Hypothetical predicted protein, partial [Pelobates cultripes]
VKAELEEYFQANSGGDVSDQTVWLAHKAVARGLFIRRSSYLKKSRQKTQLECQKLLAVATTQNKLNPSPALAKQVQTLTNQLTELNAAKTAYFLQRLRATSYHHSGKATKYLANRLK